METLPLDVVTDILARLPAKCLLRFKSVCMTWYDLISGRDFTKFHLDRSLATQSNLHLVIKAPTLHLADFDTFDNCVELNYPFKNTDGGDAIVVSSCYGLLCLTIYDHHLSLFLYNPTTQTNKLLPFLPVAPQFGYLRGHGHFGFGYDTFSRDYKCVRILQTFDVEGRSLESEVMVYSLNSDSWKRVQDVPYYFYYRNGQSAFVGGAIHWVGQTRSHVFQPIVCFDLKEETFSSIELPIFYDRDHVHMSLGVLDGCLCLMINFIYYSAVWILKEYGRPESWTRLLSVKKRWTYEHLERPVSFSICRKKLIWLVCLCQIARLDMETKEVTDVKLSHCHRCLDAWLCVENLLMLSDACDDHVSNEEHERKKSKRKKRKKKRRKNRRH